MVIKDIGLFDEDIYYCGESELEAFKKFKSIKVNYRTLNIVKAKVDKRLVKDVPFIWDYKIIEYIK
ncbi:MAG: hypothetical protein ACRC68_00600 [Clostridium sp.]